MWCYIAFILTCFYLLSGLREVTCLSHFGEDETCYSFAGGTVYPSSQKHAEHQLQTTKAVSKLIHISFTNITIRFL